MIYGGETVKIVVAVAGQTVRIGHRGAVAVCIVAIGHCLAVGVGNPEKAVERIVGELVGPPIGVVYGSDIANCVVPIGCNEAQGVGHCRKPVERIVRVRGRFAFGVGEGDPIVVRVVGVLGE